jgi:hypothetical protein
MLTNFCLFFQILVSIKAVAHAIKLLGIRGWRKVGWSKLQEHGPLIDDAGQSGRTINMLRDARENIDWRAVEPDEPDAPLVCTQDMPSPPRLDADWDYYHWVLSNSGWAAYYNSEGRPVQPPVSRICYESSNY